MACHLNGVQKRIRDKYPRAIFVHCASHCLNLVINDQNKVPIIRNTCAVIRETIHFFRESPKRRASLGINIPLFSPIGFSEKYKSIRIFKCNFKRILDALGFLMSDGSSETRAKAFSLKSALEKSGEVSYSLDNLESEMSLWRSSLSPEVNHECLQELFMSTQNYPSVRSAIQIIMELPSTTVKAERSFLCMKRVKTWLRSTMTSDRLSDL